MLFTSFIVAQQRGTNKALNHIEIEEVLKPRQYLSGEKVLILLSEEKLKDFYVIKIEMVVMVVNCFFDTSGYKEIMWKTPNLTSLTTQYDITDGILIIS